jgi:hypothetical protein
MRKWIQWRKPTRNEVGLLILVAAVATVLVVAGSIGGDSSGGGSSGGGSTVSVLYEVEGTADSTTITFTTPTGQSQGTNLAVPLTTENGKTRGIRGDFRKGSVVYISAQNMGDSGDITCRITVDGRVLSENTASGGYAIATCEGVTP